MKKKKIVKWKNNYFLLLLVGLFIFVVGAAFYGLNKNTSYQLTQNVNIKEEQEENIEDHISYKAPDTWRKTYLSGSTRKDLFFLSPDELGADHGGWEISVSRKERDNLENEIPYNPDNCSKCLSNKTYLTVDGNPAVTFDLTYEGYHREYLIAKDGYIWKIQMGTRSREVRNQHAEEFQAFINSITLR